MAVKDQQVEEVEDQQVKDDDSGDVSTDEQTDGLSEEEEEASQPLEDDADSEEESDEEEQGSLDVDDFLDEPDEKSGVQKRIDQLTAARKSAEEKNQQYESRISELEDKLSDRDIDSIFDDETPEYSPEQVDNALEKGITDGDHRLVGEIMDYKVQKAIKGAVKAVDKRQQKAIQQQQKQAKEWGVIVNDFSEYAKDNPSLDLKDRDSLLFKLSSRLYNDPSKRERYQKGGQRQAVTDALMRIMKKSGGDKQVKDLEKKLAKEKRKTSVSSSGKSMKGKKKAPKKLTQKQKLDEYLQERNK